ncbi:hypothetical protein HJG60_009864 [Phyllostomus discolor]|uniref:Pollen-specific leucine-rich repeat extensin-like protein 2 n=1 Tax=Phyllostomus discolor TaxID=89673 RepID=A0A7E6DCW8_9CHIR|nr:pollen-specific leucine-rich repeat extensin-like protein 2 [Phyllostomus discolor]XP_035876806.1 pollen-specific leucine-rich repeat extensin-like protein 2 [Phyllostomus discolor]KAF6125385.1 hypothetical protein HJG60_009864 [Phyllostomus discolor]
MEVLRKSVAETRERTSLGRCRHFFWLGVVFDTVGATVLFTGVFIDLFFYDLLLYLGSIIIFFSLLWWVFWYTGNIELIPDEALERLYHVPSAIVVNALNQAGTPSFTFTIRTFSASLEQLRAGRRRRRLLQRIPRLLSVTLTRRAEKQLAKEDQDKGGVRNVEENGDAEGLGREDLGPEQEEAKSSEGVCAPGPDAGPLGPEAGPPVTPVMQLEFTPSPLDRPLPPTILASESPPVVPLFSTSQPPAIVYSKSLSIVSLASVSQPPIPRASTSLPAVPLSFQGQPMDTLASEIQTAAPVVSQSLPLVPVASQNHSLAPMASQIYPLVSVAAQSHFQVPVASESDFQNLSPTSQTQPPAVQAAQAQALATQVFPNQLLPAPFFQSQSVDLQVTLAVQDTLHDTQQTPKNSALVQEIALSQCSQAQEPPAGQELSQEVPDTVSQLPTFLALATEAQQSMPDESVHCPTPENCHLNTEPDAQASAK